MAIDSLTWVPNLFFSNIYLSLLFNFKIGPLLDLSSLIRSIDFVVLIIRIIKTTRFDSKILMAELEEKLP